LVLEHVLDLPGAAAIAGVHDPADGNAAALAIARVAGLGADHPALVRIDEGRAVGLFEVGNVAASQQRAAHAGRDHERRGALQWGRPYRRAGRAKADEHGLRGTDGAERAGLDAWRVHLGVDARVGKVLLGEDRLPGLAERVIADLLLMAHPDSWADQL